MTQPEINSLKAIEDSLSGTPAIRLKLPMAYSDPIFKRCLVDASRMSEFVENFDRLCGCNVGNLGKGTPIDRMIDEASGFNDDQLRKFAEFVHDTVYMRLPDKAINAMRLSNLLDQEVSEN
jgi:hypothetical protein